jgi:Spy/CpxP family protein refolding chaperone
MSNRLILAPLALVGALLGGSVAAFAQAAPAPAAAAPQNADGAPVPGMHRRSKMREVLSSLDLTADQEAQIKGFMKSFRDSRQTATPETRKQLLAQIEGVLTPDQEGKFEAGMHAKAADQAPQPQQ